MTITLPSELVWVLDILGYEWPEIDEDEVRKAAVLVRQYGEDLSASVERADRIIVEEVGSALTAQAARSHAEAWNDNKSSNIRQFIDLLDPAATGVDLFADAVVALKLKVIAELVITAAQIAAAIASAVVTFGLGAAAQVALIAARKKVLDIATDIAVEQLMTQMLEMVIDPLSSLGEQLVQAMLDAPIVAGAVGEMEEMQADLAALEAASGALEETAMDQDRLTDDFVTQLMALQISTAG